MLDPWVQAVENVVFLKLEEVGRLCKGWLECKAKRASSSAGLGCLSELCRP